MVRQLQRLESQIVIERVATRLMRRHPRTFIITLHDATYSQRRHVDKVVRAFEEEFAGLGFPMQLKVSD